MTVAPSAEEFEAWREHPVTVWVLAGVRRYAELQAASWLSTSWSADPGKGADQGALDRLRTRADAYEGLAGLTFEQAAGLHDEPMNTGAE